MDKRTSQRLGAGLNRSLSMDYVWPKQFGSRNRPREISEILPHKPLERAVESSEKESTSSRYEQNSEADSKISKKTGNSHRSSLNLEKKRKAIEIEKQRRTLELKQKEIENSLHLLQMEEDLHKAELEMQENDSRSSIHFRSRKSIVSLRNESLNEQEHIHSVAQWVDNIPLHQNQDVEVEMTNNNGPINGLALELNDKGNIPSKENHSSRDDIKMLCETISNVLQSVRLPAPVVSDNSSCDKAQKPDKFQMRKIMEKDFPYFDGNPQDWPLFHKSFKNFCTLCGYTNEEVMLKLQRYLKGEAKLAVAGMLLTADNVDLVIHTLETRFGRPEFIIDTIIKRIRNISFIKDSSLERLIQFSTEVNNMVSIMKSLECKRHLENPQLIRELVSKIPEMMKLSWGEKVKSKKGEVNLEDFASWLEEKASSASYVSTPRNKINSPKYNHVYKRHERVCNTTDINSKLCNYCDKTHHESTCPLMKLDDIDRRWETVTKKKLCFSCLQKNHQKFRCRKKKPCGQNGCKLFHHPMLHKQLQNNEEIAIQEPLNENDREMVCTVKNATTTVLLRVIHVRLYGPKGDIPILALCDEASTVTLLDARVAQKLGLTGTKESLCLQWTSENVTMQEDSMRLNVKVSKATDSRQIFTLKGVRTVTNMSLPDQNIKMTDWRKFSHLQGIPVSDIENEKPFLLIGQDNIHLILARQIRSGAENLPVASRCKLGWSLHGPSPSREEKSFKAHTLHICEKQTSDEELKELVRKSYTTETFGTLITMDQPSQESSRALKLMQSTINYNGEKYEIGLLWKSEDIHLPESKFQALQRLKCVEKKCRRNEHFAKEYCQKMRDYEDKGYIIKLTPEQEKNGNSRMWYLPHFAVENPNKPNKIRLVFDAAAKSNGMSLNDALLSGPDLLQSLVAILWKFRQRRYGFCGDVKEMFHQIAIREQDRCSQRFLWRNLDYDRSPDIYEMVVMTFGATCSPVCAQFVKNYNAEKFAFNSDIQKAIINKFYVDDYLDSKDTEEEALHTISEVCRIQKLAGYELVNWMTNSQFIREKLADDMILAATKNLGETSFHRILGMWWNPENEQFSFKLEKSKLKQERPTKRTVLRALMSVFDPLGLISSFTVRGKILMQDIWRSGIDWDEILPEELLSVWTKWLKDREHISEIKIPRCYSYSIPSAQTIEIHTFCDSSENAFAAAVFLRVVGRDKIEVCLISAKTRVAPLKPLSIPRLELQASRLCQLIKKELEIPISRTFFWSDSRCVLNWIRGDGRSYKPFVSHRIGEIQERTQVEEWRWVPTDCNIADEATRSKVDRKIISDQWFSGPTFLKETEEFWPREKNIATPSWETYAELKNKQFGTCLVIRKYNDCLPDIKRFSKWMRLIRSTAWCLRFVEVIKRQRFSSNLTIEEILKAEKIWIKHVQQECFPVEIANLIDRKPLSGNSKIASLCPELKDGILVLGGRTNLAKSIGEDVRQPAILSPKHDFTKLLISHYHERFRHRGMELVVNELRQKYWVIHSRAAVKSAFSRCLKCRIEKSKPQPPMMGQIPEERLRREIRPFVNVGMDFFGPIFVKVGRRREKRWGVLFTCLAIRAIHLEIAHSLHTDSALQAILRMSARRGQPQVIFCDNGTNLRGAAREMSQAMKDLDESAIIDSLSTRGMSFKFIPPSAPHMGGAWERLIGTVKKTIGKILHDRSLREETLQTFFAETENIVNCRPLTRVSSDPTDAEALTPNHFLIGSSNGYGALVPIDPNADNLRRDWKISRNLSDSFWNRWTREYLPTLSKRSKWTDDNKPIAVDDVVILVDDQTPRYNWKLGRITATYPGPDGRVRVVDVKTSTSEYKRPVTKICKLELEKN